MRRLLRAHRAQMRVMETLIDHENLGDELEDMLIDITGNTLFWLGAHDFMDESSDAEDVEAVLVNQNAALRASAAEANVLVLAAQQMLECGRLQRAAELERERAEQTAMRAAALESHMAERMSRLD